MLLQFPGSCDERDARARLRAGRRGASWSGTATTDLAGLDAVVIPGGFSYGDYLRAGAIARFAPAMEAVAEFAADGGPVLGICNGFQVLCEAGLLPGALLPNDGLRFVCRQVELEVVERRRRVATGGLRARRAALDPGQAHERPLVRARRAARRARGARARSCSATPPGQNPNGSVADVAGVCNERGNVVGLMPHPEHAVDPLTGSADGLKLFELAVAASPPRREPAARRDGRRHARRRRSSSASAARGRRCCG